MSEQLITPALQQWIGEQLQAGHGVSSIMEAMLASGWAEPVATAALQGVMQLCQPDGGCLGMPDLPDHRGSQVWAHDKWVQVLLEVARPRIAVLGDFLSQAECSELIALALPRLSRSQTVARTTGGGEINEARTSQGMFMARGESELCMNIEARISALLGWPAENGEGIQVLRYPPGAQYRSHYDYFDPEQPGTSAILRRGGQRVATLLMYLNTPESGGATLFPDVSLSVHARAGLAVFFSYPLPHPFTQTLHGGAPVLAGEKWVATKWLRQGAFE